MRTKALKRIALLWVFMGVNALYAQENNPFEFKRIEDNSFLLEEAYNQEPGVIQHISAFQYLKNRTWGYNFTEEWPAPVQKHQLSVTIPFMDIGRTGFGDLSLNYRYQALLNKRVAFSPRFSILLPTGDYNKGLGSGVLGYQANLPVSFIVSPKLVTHYNLGATLIPNAKNGSTVNLDITSVNYGASAILLLSETFNLMLEIAGITTTINTSNASLATTHSLFLNPGFRYAINCKSGLQIVPGLAFPIGVGSSKGEYGVFMYISFEHPLWKP